MGFTCALSVTSEAVVSYTAFPPLPGRRAQKKHSVFSSVLRPGGLFLLHWPWSHLHRTLSGILPCEARTFLVCGLSAHAAAITCPAPIGSPSGNGLYYHITFGGSFQSSFLLQLPQCPQEAQFPPKSQSPQEPLPRCRSIRQTAAAASKSTTASTR